MATALATFPLRLVDGRRLERRFRDVLLPGGILCEIMKLLIRRERPETGDGAWIFRAWDDQPLSTAGLATPSSHTMVAFAGATMAARLFPRARWVFYTLAAGCGGGVPCQPQRCGSAVTGWHRSGSHHAGNLGRSAFGSQHPSHRGRV